MKKNFLKTTGLTVASVLLLSGCATVLESSNRSIASDISDDAVRLNEAFSKSTNAIILKNILRARDRWPSNFTTLSGIASKPTVSITPGSSFAPLGISNANGPFKETSGTLGGTFGSEKSYNVNPLTAGSRTDALLTTSDESTFKRYYDRWPKDVIIMMFVSNFEVKEVTNGKSKTIFSFGNAGDEYNDPGKGLPAQLKKAFGQSIDIKNDLVFTNSLITKLSPANQTVANNKNCATQPFAASNFVTSDKSNLENLEKLQAITKAKVSILPHADIDKVNISICKPDTVTQVLRLNKAAEALAPNKNRELHLTLRSFQDMVYFIGETLRDKAKAPRVEGPCDKPVTLFKLADATDKGPYAIKVRHNGKTEKALPVATGCGPDDRSATVIALLNQLLLLTQSEEFLKAPQIIDR